METGISGHLEYQTTVWKEMKGPARKEKKRKERLACTAAANWNGAGMMANGKWPFDDSAPFLGYA
jgi:hypothetical protein